MYDEDIFAKAIALWGCILILGAALAGIALEHVVTHLLHHIKWR